MINFKKQFRLLDKPHFITKDSSNFSLRVCSQLKLYNQSTIYFHYDLRKNLHLDQTSKATLQRYRNVSSSSEIIANHSLINQITLDNTLFTAIQITEKIFQSLFVEVMCPVCLETYIDPRMLSCGHSVCFACIKQMWKLNCKFYFLTN